MQMKKHALIVASIVLPLIIAWQMVLFVGSRDIPPPETSDLTVTHPLVPDADNAFLHFQSATKTFVWPETNENIYEVLSGKTNDVAFALAIINSNRQTIAELELGTCCSHCQAPEFRGAEGDNAFIHPWNEIGRFLMLKAIYERKTGDYAASAKTCALLIRFGDLVQKEPETLVQQLVGVSTMMKGTWAARELAVEDAVTADQLKALVRQLGAVTPVAEGMTRAMKIGYRVMAQATETVVTTRKLGGKSGYVFKPNATKLLFAALHRRIIEDLRLPYSQVRLPDRRPLPRSWLGRLWWIIQPNSIGRMNVEVAFCNPDVYEWRSKFDTDLAGSRLLLACRAFQIEKGDLPPSLDALVPAYLEKLPLDPYNDAPFHYSKEKGIVYSVGWNLIDDGGTEEEIKDVCDNVCRTHPKDIIFRLRLYRLRPVDISYDPGLRLSPFARGPPRQQHPYAKQIALPPQSCYIPPLTPHTTNKIYPTPRPGMVPTLPGLFSWQNTTSTTVDNVSGGVYAGITQTVFRNFTQKNLLCKLLSRKRFGLHYRCC